MDDLRPLEVGWSIQNDQQAEWALQKIKDAQKDRDFWVHYYSDLIYKVEKDNNGTIDFFRAKLSEYFGTVPHKETKTQEKYGLPSGTLILKKPKSVWKYDEQKLFDWVTDNGLGSDYIKVKRSLDWADLKKRFSELADGKIVDKETGEICDAVTVEQSEPVFDITINGGFNDGDSGMENG